MDRLKQYSHTIQTLLEDYYNLSQNQPPSSRNSQIAEHLIVD